MVRALEEKNSQSNWQASRGPYEKEKRMELAGAFSMSEIEEGRNTLGDANLFC